MEISRSKTLDNDNYMGYDEDHNGDWHNYFGCNNPKCDGYNWIEEDDEKCALCLETIEWVD